MGVLQIGAMESHRSLWGQNGKQRKKDGFFEDMIGIRGRRRVDSERKKESLPRRVYFALCLRPWRWVRAVVTLVWHRESAQCSPLNTARGPYLHTMRQISQVVGQCTRSSSENQCGSNPATCPTVFPGNRFWQSLSWKKTLNWKSVSNPHAT